MMNFVHKAACVTIFFLEVVNNGCSDSMPTIMSFTPTILVSGKINLFNDTQLACCLDQLTFAISTVKFQVPDSLHRGCPTRPFLEPVKCFSKQVELLPGKSYDELLGYVDLFHFYGCLGNLPPQQKGL